MKIRRVNQKDINQIYILIKKTKELHTTRNIYSKRLLKAILKDRTLYFIVAEEEGKIIGFSIIATWKKIGSSYWDTLAVDNNYRERGVAKALYENIVKYLKKNKISYVWSVTKKDNQKIKKVLTRFKLKKRSALDYYDKTIK
jgi:ribosomal protein S18 acetylase RimI-like enzyme